jgi:CheY-like chemotaxis protein
MTIKILVADDSVTIHKIVRLAFSAEDVVVEAVSSGDAALDFMNTYKPDIVLADVNMPGCNGYEVCARIKEDAQFSHIPVILLVGTFEAFDEAEASRVRCDKHLTKPFDTEELIQTVYSLTEYPEMFQKIDIVGAPTVEDTSTNDAKVINHTPTAESSKHLSVRGDIDPHIWDSFVGSERVLDLFDAPSISKLRPAKTDVSKTLGGAKASLPKGGQISEDFLESVADRVVRRMSSDIIREVAWEVVPELSEDIIRRTIKEQNKS